MTHQQLSRNTFFFSPQKADFPKNFPPCPPLSVCSDRHISCFVLRRSDSLSWRLAIGTQPNWDSFLKVIIPVRKCWLPPRQSSAIQPTFIQRQRNVAWVEKSRYERVCPPTQRENCSVWRSSLVPGYRPLRDPATLLELESSAKPSIVPIIPLPRANWDVFLYFGSTLEI